MLIPFLQSDKVSFLNKHKQKDYSQMSRQAVLLSQVKPMLKAAVLSYSLMHTYLGESN